MDFLEIQRCLNFHIAKVQKALVSKKSYNFYAETCCRVKSGNTITKANYSGRSMIEMLGVLTIVGILSVGALVGYQQAVFKYKLNKQAQQIGSILDYTTFHNDDFHQMTGTNHDLTSIYKKLGAIPQEMISSNPSVIYDVFKNPIYIYLNKQPNGIAYQGMSINISNNRNEICYNLLQIAQLRSSFLWQTVFQRTSEEDKTTHENRMYGDSFCQSGHNNCLRKLTLKQMEDLCSVCDHTAKQCSFFYLWDYHAVS